MKEANENYKNLVARIKAGENVPFGEMEEVFAEAFLGKFMEKVSNDSMEDRLKVLSDEEEYDEEGEPYVPEEKLTRFRIEMIRAVTGAVGVRPKVKDLEKDIEKALKGSDYALLEQIISLTEEGKLDDATLEKEALFNLKMGNDHAYDKLKERFAIQFTPEKVLEAYRSMGSYSYLSEFEKIRDETGVAIPEENVQPVYRRLFSALSHDNSDLSEGIDKIYRWQSITDVQPVMDDKIKENLVTLFGREEPLSYKFMDELDQFIGVYSSPISVDLQRAALGVEDVFFGHFHRRSRMMSQDSHLDNFLWIYSRSKHKLPDEEIQPLYEKILKSNALIDSVDPFRKLVQVTQVKPDVEIMQPIYDGLLEKSSMGLLNAFDRIHALTRVTEVEPRFEKEKLIEALEGSKDIGGVVEKILPLFGDEEIPKESLKKVGINHLTRHLDTGEEFNQAYSQVTTFFESHGVDASVAMETMKVSYLGTDLRAKIGQWGEELNAYGHSPFEPIPNTNVMKYKEFKKRIRKEMGVVMKKIKAFRKQHPDEELVDTFQHTYVGILELLLVQGARDEKDMLRLDKLIEATGMDLSRGSVTSALRSHISRRGIIYHYKSETGNIIDNIENKLGLSLSLDENLVDSTVRYILHADTPPGHKVNQVCYLYRIAKQRPSDNAKELMERKLSYREYDHIIRELGEQ